MFSVNIYMPRKKKKTLVLNGLTIEIVDSKKVLIDDKMSNCSGLEASRICSYLLQEGFLEDKGGDIECQINQS